MPYIGDTKIKYQNKGTLHNRDSAVGSHMNEFQNYNGRAKMRERRSLNIKGRGGNTTLTLR